MSTTQTNNPSSQQPLTEQQREERNLNLLYQAELQMRQKHDNQPPESKS